VKDELVTAFKGRSEKILNVPAAHLQGQINALVSLPATPFFEKSVSDKYIGGF
jgi:hypothetical protein